MAGETRALISVEAALYHVVNASMAFDLQWGSNSAKG